MPEVAKQYALPKQLAETYHIRRYGFHGLAYQSMLRIFSEQMQMPVPSINCIAMQLGSGCSICAIKEGQSVDTSMGFSPLEGLISRTRTGNIDPSAIPYLNKEAQLSFDDIFTMLNKESGLKGVSGTEGHLQQLQQDDLALQMFVYRIQQYIGAYDVALRGQYPILFGGGISEHSQEVLQLIAANSYLNIKLSVADYSQPITRITADDSPRHAYVVFVDEEREIAESVIQAI
jgi:acetate kinase